MQCDFLQGFKLCDHQVRVHRARRHEKIGANDITDKYADLGIQKYRRKYETSA